MNTSLMFKTLNNRPTDAELHCPRNNENVGLPRPGQRSASVSSLERDCSRQQTLEEATGQTCMIKILVITVTNEL